MVLKVYANLISQPARSVAWLLKVKGVEYEHVDMPFGSEFFKSEEYLAINPNGLIPAIKDDDFTLFEGNAILAYLAEKYGWDELYPKDIKKRAKVNQYLHWHHTNVRNFTLQVLRPFVKRTLGVATPAELELIPQAKEIIAKNNTLMEKLLVENYIASNDEPTIADYSAYCEYDQLESMGLLDLEKFPKVAAWIERMKKIPFHDEIRATMNGFIASTGLAEAGKSASA